MSLALGIDFDGDQLRFAKVRRVNAEECEILSLVSMPLNADPLNVTAMVQLAKDIKNATRQARIGRVNGVSSLPSNEIYFKLYRIPNNVNQNLTALLNLNVQHEADEPMRLGWSELAAYPALKKNKSYLVNICRNQSLEISLRLFELAGLKVRQFMSRPAALFNTLQQSAFIQPNQTTVIVNIGRTDYTLLLADKGEVVFARTLQYHSASLSTLLEEIYSDPASHWQLRRSAELFAAQQAMPLKHAAMEIVDEIDDLLVTSAAKLKLDQHQLDSLLVCGEDADIYALQQFLQSQLAVPVTHCDAKQQKYFRINPQIESMSGYETAIGLALERLEGDSNGKLQLIPDTIQQRAYFWSQRAFRYYAAVIFLLSSLGLYWVGNYYDSVYQQNALMIDQILRQAEQERKELLATVEGLKTVEKELLGLKEQLFRPDPTLAILREFAVVLTEDLPMHSISIDRQGMEFVPQRNLSIHIKGSMRSSPHTPEVVYTRTMEELEERVKRSAYFKQHGVQFPTREQWIRTAHTAIVSGADYWPFELRITLNAGAI